MEWKDEYPRRDGRTVITARYSGICAYCERRIVADKSRIQRRHGEWIHQRCAYRIDQELRASVA